MATNDKQRLLDQRAKVEEQKEKIDAELAGIDRELAIHDIMEKLRNGELDPLAILNPPASAVTASAPKTAGAKATKDPKDPRPDSKRAEVATVLKAVLPDGYTANEIATKLNITGAALKTLATTLSNMKKAGQITKDDKKGGKYYLKTTPTEEPASQQQAAE